MTYAKWKGEYDLSALQRMGFMTSIPDVLQMIFVSSMGIYSEVPGET